MRYNLIRKMDISNGEGVRVSIFVQGCHFHCKGCFNSVTWDFNGGKEFTQKTIDTILDLCKEDYIDGLSVLGGEPLTDENLDGVIELCRQFKAKFPTKTIWLWTGYIMEELTDAQKEVFKFIDVLIDGRFILEQKDPTLQWRGSRNQRIFRF